MKEKCIAKQTSDFQLEATSEIVNRPAEACPGDKAGLTRRGFIRVAAAGVAAAIARSEFEAPSAANTTATAWLASAGQDFVPDVTIEMQAGPSEVSLFPGQATRVWSYRGRVLSGEADSLESLADSYLGPIIRARKGQHLRVNFTNNLAEESVVHWHGLHVPPEMDAHPRYAIGPAQSYVYDLSITNRAGTYWFHPHPDGRTGPQVYNGLAGLLIVSDDEETALGLPSGDYDVPLVIQDRSFDRNNQLV